MTTTDMSRAERAKAHVKRIKEIREKLSPFQGRVGKLPDAEIAGAAGVTLEDVVAFRSWKKIDVFPDAERPIPTQDVDSAPLPPEPGEQESVVELPKNRRITTLLEPFRHLMGEVPDKDIAKLAGTHRTTVGEERRRLGIPGRRKGGNRMTSPTNTNNAKAVEKVKKRLGKESDVALAKEVGVPLYALKRYRHKLGIAGYTGHGPSGRPRRNKKVNVVETIRDRLGKETDGALAKELEVGIATVRYHRTKLGIPVLKRSNQDTANTPPTPVESEPDTVDAPAMLVSESIPMKASWAWRVSYSTAEGQSEGYVVGESVAKVALALESRGITELLKIERLGAAI